MFLQAQEEYFNNRIERQKLIQEQIALQYKKEQIFNELMQFLQIAKYDNNAMAITVVFTQYERSLLFWTIGFIHALFIGAFFGVIIAFDFDYIFTEKYYYLKGVAIGVGIYFFNFGVMSKVFSYPADIATLPGDVISMFLILVINAVVTVYALKRLKFFRRI